MNRNHLAVSLMTLLSVGTLCPVFAQQPVGPPPAPPPPISLPAAPAPLQPPAAFQDDHLKEAVFTHEAGASESALARLEPCVSLEWVGPASVRLRQQVACQIIVKNVSPVAVHNVGVRHRLPTGAILKGSEPRAVQDGQNLSWDLGSLDPRQEKRIQLQIVPEMKGDLECHAQVTFTGASSGKLKVREPKLAVKATAPQTVMLGDAANVTLMVSNPGDGLAELVKVRAKLPDGLEHPRGQVVEFDLGNLGPNENRTVQLICTAKAPGQHECEITASAEGDLKVQHLAAVNIMLPRLDLAMHGPKLRYLDRPATYVIQVKNPGSGPASNVTITHQLPPGFRFMGATAGGRHDAASRSVTWFVGDLTAGQVREVALQAMAVQTGEQKHAATAQAARGLKSEAETTTRVEGLSALLMELVDMEDPVEVGGETGYEIRITNTGSKMETNLQLICTIPEKMEFKGAKCPGGTRHKLQGNEVVFDPLPKLAPRADAVFRVMVKGVAPGDLRFRARITADGLTDAVLKEESTKVYGE